MMQKKLKKVEYGIGIVSKKFIEGDIIEVFEIKEKRKHLIEFLKPCKRMTELIALFYLY